MGKTPTALLVQEYRERSHETRKGLLMDDI
jgi:hypothetical protein